MAESQIESSNKESTTVKTMMAGTVDLSYKTKPHLPGGFSLPVVINPSIPNTLIFGNYTYFEVNNANFLSKMDVDITAQVITTAGATLLNSWHPSQMVDRVEYRNSNGLLATFFGEAVKFFYDFSPEAVKNNSYSKILDTAAATNEEILTRVFAAATKQIKIKLELPSPWTTKGMMTESLKMDLSKYTDFTVYIYFKTQLESNIPSNMAFSAGDYTMNLWTYVINQNYVDNLLKLNGGVESSKVFTYDFTRSSTLTGAIGSTQTTLTSRKQNFLTRSFLRLVPVKPVAAASLAEWPIISLQIQFNGTNVFQGSSNTMTGRELNSYSKDKLGASSMTYIYGAAADTLYADNRDFCGVCIPWKMLEDMGVFSGGISTKDLVNITYIVNHKATLVAADYRLVLVDEVSSVLDYDASSYNIVHFTPS